MNNRSASSKGCSSDLGATTFLNFMYNAFTALLPTGCWGAGKARVAATNTNRKTVNMERFVIHMV